MSDFPKQPLLPEPGSPNFIAPEKDSRENHPVVDNSGPSTVQDWDQTPMTKWLVDTYAEREGCSAAEAMQYIKNGAEDLSTHARPRSEVGTWTKWQSDGDE